MELYVISSCKMCRHAEFWYLPCFILQNNLLIWSKYVDIMHTFHSWQVIINIKLTQICRNPIKTTNLDAIPCTAARQCAQIAYWRLQSCWLNIAQMLPSSEDSIYIEFGMLVPLSSKASIYLDLKPYFHISYRGGLPNIFEIWFFFCIILYFSP